MVRVEKFEVGVGVGVGVVYKFEEDGTGGVAFASASADVDVNVGELPNKSRDDTRVEREARRVGKAAWVGEEFMVMSWAFAALLCASVDPTTRNGRFSKDPDIGAVDVDMPDVETGRVIWREGEASPNPPRLAWRGGEVKIDREEGDVKG